ncbi:MAG: indole-3-glycerol phosphate synthase TrpC [Bacteroidaceae bacterium]|nr:indole-3-glycerol phosphate synthase TrpC [Bacteroidaceae bacterium]
MKDVLEEIVAWKRREVEQQKYDLPAKELYAIVERLMLSGIEGRSMRQSLEADAHGIIAEFKRRSPSKGWIHEEARPQDVVPAYASNGAAALSILTDEKFFGGSLAFIERVRPLVAKPIMRKEFIIDEYQLFQARRAGADAVLLIAADLSVSQCRALIGVAHQLSLEVFLELHDEAELDYAELDADMIGVNNRHLGTFITDVSHSFDMASRLPGEKLWVSESGISSPDTIRQLRRAGYRGFLMGEYFMRAANPGLALREFVMEL